MTFVVPSVLLLLAAVSAMGLFILWRLRRREKNLRAIAQGNAASKLIDSTITFQKRFKAVLWLFTVAALIFTLARPQWGTSVEVVETIGASVYIVLDVSRSMLAEDIQPSRLERARLDAREIAQALDGEIGLIVFAGEAYVQFPLTTDSGSAMTFLNSVDTNAISRQGTVIEAALRLALRLLPNTQTVRAVILLSDGENHEGDAVAAARDAAIQDVPVYVIGYGDDDGEEIPIRDMLGNIVGYHEAADGELVLSRIDEPLLEAVANAGQGIYRRATAGGGGSADVIAAIQSLGGGSTEESRTQVRGIERFSWFVLLALVTLGLEIGLPGFRRLPE